MQQNLQLFMGTLKCIRDDLIKRSNNFNSMQYFKLISSNCYTIETTFQSLFIMTIQSEQILLIY